MKLSDQGPMAFEAIRYAAPAEIAACVERAAGGTLFRSVAEHSFCFACERFFRAGSSASAARCVCPDCGLSMVEQAGLYLAVRMFGPTAESAIGVRGSAALAAGLRQLTQAVSLPAGAPVDVLLVDEMSGALAGDAVPSALAQALLPGGGLVWNCGVGGPGLPAFMRGVEQAGFTELALVEVRATDGIEFQHLFLTARRARAVAAPIAQRGGRSPVSVVIPLYNHEKYIAAALESVFTQSRPPAEVIVIDDGSRDGSADVASRLCKEFDGAAVYRQENRGAHNTINAAIARSTQPLIAILNSDDIYGSSRLEKCTDLIRERRAAIVTSSIEFINDEGAAIPNPWYESALAYWRECGNTALALLNGNFIMTTSNLVLERKVFSHIGGFKDFRYAHDLDFFIRALAHGYAIHGIAEPLLKYRYHASNTISENHTKVRAEWAYICADAMLHHAQNLKEELTVWEFLERMNKLISDHNLAHGVMSILREMAAPATVPQEYAQLAATDGFQAHLLRSLV
ncbi:glycosyltransferase family 2 protein [Massilia sp. SM-13]|uniref:glycosyltransferase family 2 protein n=1 Tax=Pseudoduganella rhizocola TaxID=3382643 RepID=UPI0038B514CB